MAIVKLGSTIPAVVASGSLTLNVLAAWIPTKNDIIIAQINSSDNADYTMPSGFTQLSKVTNGIGREQIIAWRRTDTTDNGGSSYVFGRSGGNSATGVMIAFRGCEVYGSPIDAFSSGIGSGAGAVVVAMAAINTTLAGDMVMIFGGSDRGELVGSVKVTDPAALVLQWSSGGTFMYEALKTTIGSTGIGLFGHAFAATSVGHLVALREPKFYNYAAVGGTSGRKHRRILKPFNPADIM